MNKSLVKTAWLSLVAAFLVPALGMAQVPGIDTNKITGTNALQHLTPRNQILPLHGYVVDVNTGTMTLTVGDTVLGITPKTKIAKAGKMITLSDIKVGDLVNLSYAKSEDGSKKALGIHVVPHAPAPPRQPNDAETPQPATHF